MSKSTPKAPDYEGAAAQQAQSSKEVTEQQTWANRADQFTPWGNQTWQNQQVWDPATNQYINRWAQTTQLDPTLDQANKAQMDTTLGRSNLANSLTGRMQNEFGQAMDWNQFTPQGSNVGAPDQVQGGNIQSGLSTEGLTNLDPSQKYRQDANDAIYNQWASRALPQQEKDTDRLRTQLYNMGLKEGDSAYNDEMERQRQTQGDAMQQAQYQATIGSGAEAQRMLGMDASTRAQMFGERGTQGQFGNQAQAQDFNQMSAQQQQQYQNMLQSSQYQNQQRQQQIAEAQQARGQSLNEMNALLSGQQVNMPNMPSYNTAARSEGNQALQAAQLTGQAELDRFNAKQQATQGMMSGLGSMAGAGMMMSDRRFKEVISRIGTTPGGVPLYEFRYIWGGLPYVGVMADDVPHAVVETAGIKFVNYAKVH
jgi:hypothetical protein